MAGFKSERWPVIDRNAGRLQIGIRNEVVVSTFLAGTGAKTLPIKLFEQIRVEFTPVAAVGSTAILAVTIVLFGIVQFSRRKGQQTNE